MNALSSRIALLLVMVLASTFFPSLRAQAPASTKILTEEQQQRYVEQQVKTQKAVDALEKKDPVDDLALRLRTKIRWQQGQPPLPAQKMFEGFILDDESLERDLWEMIRPNALLARQIIPLNQELKEAEARAPAPIPFLLRTKSYVFGETEVDQVTIKIGQAELAKRRVETLIGSLRYTNDVRTARLFGFLLWEPGEYRVEEDYGVSCLRDTACNSLYHLVINGVLDVDKKYPTEAEWRAWWLENKWKWGWSYEIDPITNTKIFPATKLSAGVFPQEAPTPAPPPPQIPIPAVTPATKLSSPVPQPPPEPSTQASNDRVIFYVITGATALLLALLISLRRKK